MNEILSGCEVEVPAFFWWLRPRRSLESWACPLFSVWRHSTTRRVPGKPAGKFTRVAPTEPAAPEQRLLTCGRDTHGDAAAAIPRGVLVVVAAGTLPGRRRRIAGPTCCRDAAAAPQPATAAAAPPPPHSRRRTESQIAAAAIAVAAAAGAPAAAAAVAALRPPPPPPPTFEPQPPRPSAPPPRTLAAEARTDGHAPQQRLPGRWQPGWDNPPLNDPVAHPEGVESSLRSGMRCTTPTSSGCPVSPMTGARR